MTLTTLPHDPLLDLDPWVGQRQASFRFALTDGFTGEKLGDITPLRGASLSHDTSRTIKRELDLSLGVTETADIDTIKDRVSVFMVFPNGQEYPLGRYMFTDSNKEFFTSGRLGSMALVDEMFMVDQQIIAGISGLGRSVASVVQDALENLPVQFTIEASTFGSVDSWGIGTSRGSVLEAAAVSGDYFSPWFGNDTKLHFIRTFNPAYQVVDLDFDSGNKVLREGIGETDDLLIAPNRFVVISNAADDPRFPVIGVFDVSPNAPHSISNRGFVIAEVQDLQASSEAQALAMAEGLANRQTVYQRVNLATAPDPRHDSYNVIKWQGENWLELAWSMNLVEGGAMSHVLRRSYL